MLSRLCAQCRIWTTITSLSGTSEIFVTLSHTLTGRKNFWFSVMEKCVMRYRSNLRNFVLSVSVSSLPIVQTRCTHRQTCPKESKTTSQTWPTATAQ